MDGRSKNGGARPGAGRKSKSIEAGLNDLLDSIWTPERKTQTIEKIAFRAEQGDLEAAKFLFAYRFGKPIDRIEVTGEDGGPVQIQMIEAIRPDGA